MTKHTAPDMRVAKDRFWSYVVGFVSSLSLTVCAYLLVKIHLNSGHLVPSDSILLYLLVALALTQFIMQLLFFLHLDTDKKPRWRSIAFISMIAVVSILVFGTIWIMNNLNYHMAAPASDSYIMHDEGIQ